MRLPAVFILICFCLTNFLCKKNTGGNTPPPDGPNKSFLRVSGTSIEDSAGMPVQLQGVAFGNEVWSNDGVPATHHNEKDFERVKNMGMNLVRFYMNYKTFENDASPYNYKQSGWDWIDQNIIWARKHGVFLLLNMHVPQGGYQSQGTGDALWNIPENQNRLAALWKAIADRYKNEPQIIGFGLVNEPVPARSMQQWQQLAQKTINAIRSVDKSHIVFVEKAIWVKGADMDANLNFPDVTDANLVYEFHSYDPIEYTHQLFSWAGFGEGGRYPDETLVAAANATWYTATFNNPNAPGGNSGWQYFEGDKYKITDPKIKLGLPALVGAKVGNGKIYFDDLQLKEFDASGNYLRDVLQMNLNTLDGWNYWSSNNTGTKGLSAGMGHGDDTCLYITGATDDCNLSNARLFEPVQGHYYQLNGWMKGDAVPASAACKLRIDMLTTNQPVQHRNKQYLQTAMQPIIDWATLKKVPLYMGEFGAGMHCFENNKGGLQWVSDMIDIAKANKIAFSYHAYHEDSFGLYLGYGSLPDPNNVNQPLIDLLTAKLK
jgi:endoglucanase